MSTQRHSEINKHVFKVIESFEQNIRKQIDCKRPSSTKQMNRVQNSKITLATCDFNNG